STMRPPPFSLVFDGTSGFCGSLPLTAMESPRAGVIVQAGRVATHSRASTTVASQAGIRIRTPGIIVVSRLEGSGFGRRVSNRPCGLPPPADQQPDDSDRGTGLSGVRGESSRCPPDGPDGSGVGHS